MAKKSILGIDIGSDRLKIALVDGGIVLDAVTTKMPENLMKGGRLSSVETMSDLIARTMKENGIKVKDAAICLQNENVYIKNVKMPMMNTEQLVYNLPFEFNDYITGEVKDYVFDYAVLPDDEPEEAEAQEAEKAAPAGEKTSGETAEADKPEKAEDAAKSGEKDKAEKEAKKNRKGEVFLSEEMMSRNLNLMAVGAEKAYIDECSDMLRKAGLNMVKAAPSICAYITLIREQMDQLRQYTDEFCVLDLGYEATRLYMFKEDQYEATRVIDAGLSSLERVISDLYGVESHLAHTYMMNNFENCLDREECRESFENIAVELMRAMNFYRFSNPDSALTDMWLCGGGAVIQPLCDAIGGMLDMRLHTASELVPDGDDIPECNSFIQAIGIAFEI